MEHRLHICHNFSLCFHMLLIYVFPYFSSWCFHSLILLSSGYSALNLCTELENLAIVYFSYKISFKLLFMNFNFLVKFFTFSFIFLNILTTVIINPLSENSNICITFEFVSTVCFSTDFWSFEYIYFYLISLLNIYTLIYWMQNIFYANL